MLWADPETVIARTRSKGPGNIMARVDERHAKPAVKRYESYAMHLCRSAGIEVFDAL